MLKVRQSTDISKLNVQDTKITRTCKDCPVFDTLDEEFNTLNKAKRAGDDDNANAGTR